LLYFNRPNVTQNLKKESGVFHCPSSGQNTLMDSFMNMISAVHCYSTTLFAPPFKCIDENTSVHAGTSLTCHIYFCYGRHFAPLK
jgi:hypothetical protein